MNYIILLSFILLISGTIGELIEIQLTAINISLEGGCIWQNSSFTVYANSTNKITTENDTYFNLDIKEGENLKSAYCRIPKLTDVNEANIYCSTEVSNKKIILPNTDTHDEKGEYHIQINGNLMTGTTQKCEESYLIQNLVLLIALIGLLI